MAKNEIKCYLCDSNIEEKNFYREPRKGLDFYICQNCGSYYIHDIAKNLNPEDKAKAASVACEKKLKKQDGYYLNVSGNGNSDTHEVIKIEDFLKEFPKNPTNRFQRALLNLGRVFSAKPFDNICSASISPYLLFISSDVERQSVLELMREERLIHVNESQGDAYRTPAVFTITPKGWKQIVELQEQYKEHSGKAFLAMWFDDTTQLFKEAARKGAKDAGYELLAVNEEHYNDFIMNKVLNMIDESKFVIADFTCMPEIADGDNVSNGVRGGVYYEAGFANGQGKEVIMTCKNISEAWARRHFDIEQKNTIIWKEEDGKIITSQDEFDFADYLKERIIRSVGRGPNYKE